MDFSLRENRKWLCHFQREGHCPSPTENDAVLLLNYNLLFHWIIKI